MQYYGADFRLALRNLRKHCPVPTVVRTVPHSVLLKYHQTHPDEMDIYGDCLDISKVDKTGSPLKTKRLWRIRIARGRNESEAIETLVHEWAHALDEYHNGPSVEEHRQSWGEFYSIAYRVVYCTNV